MVHLDIFLLGLFVTIVTIAAVILVGLHEASDPFHSRPQDLNEWERRLVQRPDLDREESATE
jgi:hypothetical protein